MNSINEVRLLGNITNDPELVQTQSGSVICKFSIATNRGVKQADGSYQDFADFHRCTAFGNLADRIAKWTKKGDKIHVSARLQNNSWTTKDGEKKYSTEIIVQDAVFLTPKPKGEKSTYEAAKEVFQEEPHVVEDDLPF